MGKLIKIEKNDLKISAKEHEKELIKDEFTANVMKKRDQNVKKSLKKSKEQ